MKVIYLFICSLIFLLGKEPKLHNSKTEFFFFYKKWRGKEKEKKRRREEEKKRRREEEKKRRREEEKKRRRRERERRKKLQANISLESFHGEVICGNIGVSLWFFVGIVVIAVIFVLFCFVFVYLRGRGEKGGNNKEKKKIKRKEKEKKTYEDQKKGLDVYVVFVFENEWQSSS